MTDTKLRKTPGYSRSAVFNAISEELDYFEQHKITGRIAPIIDLAQGTVAGLKMGREVGVKQDS